MKKIPTIFKRNPENMKEITHEHHNDCEWVFNGEGIATRKYDGTCCLIRNGKLWKRRELKKGSDYPAGFELADYDEVTGKTVGWMPVEDTKEDRWHLEALGNGSLPDGTYELCGPKIQGNHEGYNKHVLIPHNKATQYDNIERTYEGIRDFLNSIDIEGIVFHHPDGRMGKIKKRDYGLKRNE